MATHSTHVRSIDHLVLTVADLRATVDFYSRLLGMEERTFSGRTALHLGDQKINLHEAGHEFEPKAARPTPGSGDLCFVVGGPYGLELERADHRLSLGPLTLPHQLARVVLLEQLFRAHKILKNEPYHH